MKKIIIKILKFLFGYHKSDRTTLKFAIPVGIVIAVVTSLFHVNSPKFPSTWLNIPFYLDPIWMYGTILLLRFICWESFFLIRRFYIYLIGV